MLSSVLGICKSCPLVAAGCTVDKYQKLSLFHCMHLCRGSVPTSNIIRVSNFSSLEHSAQEWVHVKGQRSSPSSVLKLLLRLLSLDALGEAADSSGSAPNGDSASSIKSSSSRCSSFNVALKKSVK